MASAERRYVEVFYDFADEYPAIYADDAAFATWLRLLMLANGIWPAPAAVPRSVSEDSFEKLVTAGLVTVLEGDLYRIRGLDKLRRSRRDRAQHAAEVRWGTAPAMQEHSASSAEAMPHSTTEQITTGQSTIPLSLVEEETNEEGSRSDERTDIQRRDDERFVGGAAAQDFVALARQAEQVTGVANVLRNPLSGYARSLQALVDIHGLERVLDAMQMVTTQIPRPTIRELTHGTEELMTRRVSAAEQRAAERTTEQRQQAEASVLRTLRSQHFQHTEPHPRCPACQTA